MEVLQARWVLYVVDSSCFLVGPAPPFSFGVRVQLFRSCSQVLNHRARGMSSVAGRQRNPGRRRRRLGDGPAHGPDDGVTIRFESNLVRPSRASCRAVTARRRPAARFTGTAERKRPPALPEIESDGDRQDKRRGRAVQEQRFVTPLLDSADGSVSKQRMRPQHANVLDASGAGHDRFEDGDPFDTGVLSDARVLGSTR